MITELRAQNFKSWKDTGELQFAPLTGFFGANSSGKSSILQVLLMLTQTVKHPSPDWNEPLYFGDEESRANLGSFDDIIRGHNEDLKLGIFVSWKLPETTQFELISTDSLSFSTSIAKKAERPDLVDLSYMADRENFKIEGTGRAHKFEYLDVIPRTGDSIFRSVNVAPFRCYGVVNPGGRLGDRLGALLTCKGAFENLFSRIRYLGPRRENPRRHYRWEESHPNDVGHYGEKMISALLSSRVRLRSTDEQIMKWLQRLELIYSYDINPTSNTEQDYELLVQQYKDGPKVGLTDVGFGVSQVLPLLALCYYADEGSILILEQPESHLHPKVQSELADVLIDVVKNRNVQIILESHSEHLLHRLTRRIAEEKISENDMALYFCEINDGKSTAEKLKVDEYGNISNWPQNFFGDEMGDLAAKARAEIKRKKANKQ